jgi:hypothetical protein
MKPLRYKFHLNNILKTSSYLNENSVFPLSSGIKWLTLFREVMAVYSENHTKPINTHCGQSAELFKVKLGGIGCKHCALKG